MAQQLERLGRFRLPANFSSSHSAVEICSKLGFVSFHSYFDENAGVFEFSGLSPLFDEIAVQLDTVAHDAIQKYDVVEKNGEYSVKKSHIFSA